MNKNETECSGKLKALKEDTTCNFEDEDFNLASDVSDEDLVNAAQESEPDEANGLKGGGPISATENISDDLDISILHDTSSDRNSSIDSSMEKSASKGTVLKNSPILFVKQPNGNLTQKRKPQDKINTNKTPTLGKFDGNLFEDSVKENKSSLNNLSAKERPRSSLYSTAFRDEDMVKAINMSLQDQRKSTDEDDELKRVLQLSLQEFEEQGFATDQPESPAAMDTENLTDSNFQDDEGELSTHSYRLVSIVSHLGTRSTSGHYISDVFDCKTKQWTSYDDSTATKISEHGVRYKRQHSGYIFFYLYKQCVDAIENASPCKENSQR